ncbi:MAG: hypothetical protein ACRCYS_10460 [Beijerinckiaceae bacterium]
MRIRGAPWKFSPSHIEEGPSAVRADDGWIVCTTSSDEHAQLIAAAPEMLAALKVASLWSDGDWVGYEYVTKAIAKATGR